MPMDIRNFFAAGGGGKKGGGGDKDKKKSKKKAAAKSKPAISAALSPIDEEGPTKKRSGDAKKVKKIIIEDSDDDSDATTDMDVVVDSKPSASSASSKSKAAPKLPKRTEVSADDFFSSSSPAAKSSPKKEKMHTKQEIDAMLDDDDTDDVDMALLAKSSSSSSSNKKRPPPQEVAKDAPKKPMRKTTPVKSKRPKLDPIVKDDDSDDDTMGESNDNDNDKDDDDDDDEFVVETKNADSDSDDDDDYLEEPPKVKSPPKKKRVASPAVKKSPAKTASPSAAASPPSSKKRKATPSSSSRKSPPVKKEEPIEPTLEMLSYDTDKAVPECFQGHTFVFTGVLQGMTRDDAQDYVKILGGRVTTAISSKTTYLVVGEVLEDGRPYTEGTKYRGAVERGTHIVMGEKKLYGLAKLYSDKLRENMPAVATGKENNTAEATAPVKPVVANPYAKKIANPYAKKANPYAKPAAANHCAKKSNGINPYAKKNTSASASVDSTVFAKGSELGRNALWVDKHAPSNTQEILGNKDLVSKLNMWLARWESRFNNDKAVGKSFSDKNGPLKAALLSGPPGIGKTTTATLVAKEAGRDLIEFNASDVRSKKSMKESMGDITGSQSVQGYFQQGVKEAKSNVGQHTKRCIIMDEVDGMGGGDRGGMAELIQMIKHSRVPIICICNDRQSQKMKSLLPYCLDLRFKRPQKGQIAKTAMRIAEREGLRVEQNAAEAMAESCGNDIRQVLNALQMWASDGKAKDDNSLTYKGLKDRESSINKDSILRVNLFDAAKTIMEGRKGLADATPEAERASFFKRTDAFFVDYSFTALLVQQNYLKVMNHQFNDVKRQKDDAKALEFLENVHSAAESLSDYALVENKIRGGSDMNWGLLPFSSVLAVKTGFHAGGPNGTFFPGFPEFTTWLGRNSTKGKKNRILQELNHHMNYKVSGGTQEVRLSYLPFLRQRFLSQLKDSQDEDKNAVAIHLMDEYGLDRDDVFENLDEFKMDPKGPKMADIDSKVKAAFTREYNKGSHKSQALVEEQGAAKKKRGAGGGAAADPDDPDAINDDAQEDDEENEEEDLAKLAAAFKKKGKGRTKSTGKAPAKGKGKTKKK